MLLSQLSSRPTGFKLALQTARYGVKDLYSFLGERQCRPELSAWSWRFGRGLRYDGGVEWGGKSKVLTILGAVCRRAGKGVFVLPWILGR